MTLFTRYRILNATRALVSEVGVERVTMRKIAAMANITAAAIYKHFRNKRALLDRVIDDAYFEMGGRMFSKAMRGPPDIHVVTDQVLGYARDYPKLMQMMLAPRTDDSNPVGHLRAQVEKCMRARVVDCMNPIAMGQLLWAQLRGLLSRDYRDEEVPPLLDRWIDESLRPRLDRAAA
jgi:AcrR family transcriptional regulator